MNTKIFAPYTKQIPEVIEAMNAYKGKRWIDHINVGKDDTSYWHELIGQVTDCIKNKCDLVIIEHDIVINKDTLQSFDDCQNIWCGSPYQLQTLKDTALGCTRLRYSLLVKYPNLVYDAGKIPLNGRFPEGHWKRLDSRIKMQMQRLEISECINHREVKHLHDYSN